MSLAAVGFERVPPLDGIRGVALLLVILGHISDQLFPGGRIGVDLFFVLSGFLITSILLGEYRQTGSISVPRFYLRRALRLFPALFSVVLFGVIYAWFTEDPARFDNTITDAKWVVGYIWNWRLVMSGQNVADHQHMFMHMWSLSVEEQFYIIWPFLALALLWLNPPRWAIGGLFAAGILGPEIGRLIFRTDPFSLSMYFNGALRSDALMWGAGLAWLLHLNVRLPFLAVLGPIAFVGLIWMSHCELLSSGALYVWGFSLAALLSATAIAAVATGQSALLVRSMGLAPLRWVGKISYGLYLWHVPVWVIVERLPVAPAWKSVLIVAATFAVSTVSFYYYEQPFLRLKDRIGHKKPRAEVSSALGKAA